MTLQLAEAGLPVLSVPRHRRTTVVIGHRGASGYRPEHTLAAYELAIRLGADAIEPDLVSTRDGVLVARHENEISGTTDVARRREFADRRTTKTVDGRRQTGWFTEDFTLAELKTLRATERLGGVRPANKLYDGRWEVATLDEILALVERESLRAGRRVGLVLELKHSTYFASLGLPLEPVLLEVLQRHGISGPATGVLIESFETTNLRWLATQCDLPLVQLVEATGAPADLAGSGVTYADLVTPSGLAEVATYALGVSVHKDLVLPRDPATGRLQEPSGLVRDAHATGLLVLVWTLRAENAFLPVDFRVGSEPHAHGDLRGEVRAHVEAGVDGVFTDFPDLACSGELPRLAHA
jgi:glycerophosphoryl diester phosphodiesterase